MVFIIRPESRPSMFQLSPQEWKGAQYAFNTLSVASALVFPPLLGASVTFAVAGEAARVKAGA